MDKQKHNELIKEQFAKQASAYTAVKAHSISLENLVEITNVSKKDNVLDIACGSGIVSCEFAKYANHVTGIDITEAMLQQAQTLQQKNNLSNIDWVLDDVLPLKFDNEQFSIVLTRFSFHHFIDYEKVFNEMIRVCNPNGTVMVIDVAVPCEKKTAYDNMEKLRDPSHTGVLTIDDFNSLFRNDKLINLQSTDYLMEIELETQLDASFPVDREKLRLSIIQDIHENNLGVNVSQLNDKYYLYYPVHIFSAQKK